jgi:hypothetical protein
VKGGWVCSLDNGITVELGVHFNPGAPTDYEKLALQALQTEAGVKQLLDSISSGAKFRIGEKDGMPWYAWGGADETKTGVVFSLGRQQI